MCRHFSLETPDGVAPIKFYAGKIEKRFRTYAGHYVCWRFIAFGYKNGTRARERTVRSV